MHRHTERKKMKVKIKELIEKSRIALDELRVGEEDDFSSDLDTEIRQALLLAANELMEEAPADKLEPKAVVATVNGDSDYDPIRTEYSDGHGSLAIPDDFLLLYELRLRSWQGTVTTLLEPGSNEAQMQRSRWTRGTPQKPKAMLETDGSGQRVITYWTAGRYAVPSLSRKDVYDHTVERFTYIPKGSVSTDSDGDECLSASLSDDCERNIIYRALSLVLTTKKETELAGQARELSSFG